MSYHLVLFDANYTLCEYFKTVFKQDDVTVFHTSLEGLATRCRNSEISIDAIVSPANSFGFMDGGIDLYYLHLFGMKLQERVQQQIQKMNFGELLVGQAIHLPTENEVVPNIICSPTMRVPNRAIADDIFMAARAALAIAKAENWCIAMPGMGTGIGGLDYASAATQIKKAYDRVKELHYSPKIYNSVFEATMDRR